MYVSRHIKSKYMLYTQQIHSSRRELIQLYMYIQLNVHVRTSKRSFNLASVRCCGEWERKLTYSFLLHIVVDIHFSNFIIDFRA